jgi:sec-independent protein translocase protein TatA
MLGLRLPEILIILVVVLLVFGAKKIPELGDALGKGIRAFKKASDKAFDQDDSGDTASKAQQDRQLPHGSATATPPSPAATDKAEKKV